MKRLMNIQELESVLEQHAINLFVIKAEQCGVCEAVQAQLIPILENHPKINAISAYINDVPELSGKYLAFTAPVVLLFVEGKEVYRAARFIQMEELVHVIKQWEEMLEQEVDH
ncbi:thioredoxin family protein [Brevibacillus daliensis]|uniref:thioredoxin family protein n=1 Tax=Brevibacillus daliensis TaxID=2892995 RepID=UPI001E359D52|nr:thioredoxin family protein [Brevibacillus daliensis]